MPPVMFPQPSIVSLHFLLPMCFIIASLLGALLALYYFHVCMYTYVHTYIFLLFVCPPTRKNGYSN